MKSLENRTAILTGASGGLGFHLVRTLAAQNMNLLLVAYPGAELPKVAKVASEYPAHAEILCADLRLREERARVVDVARSTFGDVHLLVNNAGVEYSGALHSLSLDQIDEVLAVNLHAPMALTRLLLPQMLGSGAGHIVNIASLAGRAGPGFQEPYAATKAGLIAFTLSLRASYRGTGISASVITPGFVEAGIYTRLKERTGRAAPALLGASSPESVCKAMLAAIRRDIAEIVVSRYPVRPILALSALFPPFGEWFNTAAGVNQFFRLAAGTAPDANVR